MARKIKTAEEFITQAKRVHGDKYDYSKNNLYNWRRKGVYSMPNSWRIFIKNPRNH